MEMEPQKGEEDRVGDVNTMAENLTIQVRVIVEVTTAVAKGYLTQKIIANTNKEILDYFNFIIYFFLFNFIVAK